MSFKMLTQLQLLLSTVRFFNYIFNPTFGFDHISGVWFCSDWWPLLHYQVFNIIRSGSSPSISVWDDEREREVTWTTDPSERKRASLSLVSCPQCWPFFLSQELTVG